MMKTERDTCPRCKAPESITVDEQAQTTLCEFCGYSESPECDFESLLPVKAESVLLSTGRTVKVTPRTDDPSVSDIEMTDGGEMSDQEWDEYARLVTLDRGRIGTGDPLSISGCGMSAPVCDFSFNVRKPN